MNNEVAINHAGAVATIRWSRDEFHITKESKFNEELASTLEIIPYGEAVTTLGEDRRKWMHDKLDAWINGELDE
jgi:hypothetical protein